MIFKQQFLLLMLSGGFVGSANSATLEDDYSVTTDTAVDYAGLKSGYCDIPEASKGQLKNNYPYLLVYLT